MRNRSCCFLTAEEATPRQSTLSNTICNDWPIRSVCRFALLTTPSYCSKYNPIERRFFPHVSRACTGKLFKTLNRVVSLMRNAATSTGLRTTVNVIRRTYETGRNATEEIKRLITKTVKFEDLLPKWNYTLIPHT